MVDQFVWAKESVREGELGEGMGVYLRHCHEICIISLKGRAPSDARLHHFKDTLLSKKGIHSQKPDYIHEVAEDLCPEASGLNYLLKYII